MKRLTARVLDLPIEQDLREEAERLGVPAAELEALAGSLAVKLAGVPATVARTIEATVVPLGGLAILARSELQTLVPKDGLPVHAFAPVLDLDSGGGDLTQVVVAGSRALLMDVAGRLERSQGTAEDQAGAELRGVLDRYSGKPLGTTRCGGLTLEWGRRTYVMGIINVTPDSFSGDGTGTDVDAAVAQGKRFVEEGADILDVGGESTRPGSDPVSVEEELRRVLPVIERLATEVEVPVSVDSYKAAVGEKALEAGATMLNDVWGLRRGEELADLAAARGVPIVLMHNRRATAARSQLGGHFKQAEYADLMGEIVEDLAESIETALRHGVRLENVIVDPGIGFGKTPAHNLIVMRRLREVRSLGRPILMGTSRKSVVGLTLGVPMHERVEGTAATVAVSIRNGADIVRVHDVKEMVRVARMTDAIVRAKEP